MTSTSPTTETSGKRKRWYSALTSGVGLAAITTTIGVVATWYYAKISVEPVYYTAQSEEVAKKASPRLTVQWDGQPIGNLCVGRIAIWNRGKLPIRSGDLPESDPLRIVGPSSGRILSIESSRSSRERLRIGIRLLSDAPNVALLSLLGNDALENGDGMEFRILYVGGCSDASFAVVGRVVGSPIGFTRVISLAPIDMRRLTRWDGVLAIVISIVCGLLFVLAMSARIGSSRYKKRKVKQLTDVFSKVADDDNPIKNVMDKIKERPASELTKTVEGKSGDEAIDAILALEGSSLDMLKTEYGRRFIQKLDSQIDTMFSDMPRYILFSAFQGLGFIMGVVSLLALVYAALVSAQPSLPAWLG